MRVLFLTQVLPYPLDAGPKVRAYYTLRHLSERGNDITLVSLSRRSDPGLALEHLKTLCSRVATIPIRRSRIRDVAALGRSLFSGAPLLIARDHVAAMHEAVKTIAIDGKFDVIHTDQLWMAPYALAARAASEAAGVRPRLILDQHNAVYLIPARMAAAIQNPIARMGYGWESTRMAKYERHICLAFDEVVTVTEQDRRSLLNLYATADKPHMRNVIPICVDPGPVPVRQPRPGSAKLLFVGGMHWPPNADGVEWFARYVLPKVRQHLPGTSLTAVGRPPTEARQRRLSREGVELPGYVDDLRPLWDGCSAFVVPLRAGGGMRVKILDAWTRGIPVISTSIGAEGLAVTHEANILLADTAGDFAEAVIRVLTDAPLAAALARGGRLTVETHYHWRSNYQAWDSVYAHHVELSASAKKSYAARA